MKPTHAATAVIAAAAASAASATIATQSSITALVAESTIEISGVRDAADPIAEFFFVLDDGPFGPEDRSNTAEIDDGVTTAALTASGAATATQSQIDIDFSASTTANITPDEPDAFGFVKSRVASLTRFTTAKPVEITLSGSASTSFALLGANTPLSAQTLIRVLDENDPKNILFSLEDFDGTIDQTFTLDPGAYQFQIAADSTFEIFGFPNLPYAAASSLDLQASIVAIPAPGAGALVALAAAGTRRRR